MAFGGGGGSLTMPTLVQRVQLDTSGATKSAKQIEGQAGAPLKRFFSGLSKEAKVTAGVLGVGAAGGLFAVIKTGFQEAKDASAGAAQLEAGIRSTGNAAHVSVPELEDLASSIQGYSGQTDDSIVASEKLLLTFTGVRNEVGKGNDIFTQAVKISADLAAKMGGDASTNAIKLGKALNDPTKGLTALTRIGVSFNAQQVEQVKALDASGNKLGAQKIIIAELNKEFGGAAKAAGDSLPGALAKAQRSFEDMSQEVVETFAPAIASIAGVASHAFSGLNSLNKATGGWLVKGAAAAAVAGVVGGGIFKLVGTVRSFTSTVGAGAKGISSFVETVRIWALINPSLATGIGLAAGAAIAFAAVLVILANRQSGAEKAAKDLTDAVKTEGETLGTATAQKLADFISGHAGASDALKATGLSVRDLNNAIQGSDAQYDSVIGKLHDYRIEQERSGRSGDEQVRSAFALFDAVKNLRGGYVSAKETIEGTNAVTKELSTAHQDATKSSGSLADQTVKTTDEVKAEKKAHDELVKSLDKLADVAGPAAARVAEAMHLTRDQVDRLTSRVADFNKGFESAFDGATNVIDQFKDKSKVSFQEFVDAQFKTIVATQNWASNLALLAKAGINQGFLKTLVDAGPSSAALVQSIVDNTKNGSVKTINQLSNTIATSKQKTERLLDDYQTGVIDFTTLVNNLKPHLDVIVTANGKPIITNQFGQPIAGSALSAGNFVKRSASGNRLRAGEPSIVGEKGYEVFVPDVAGTVVPHSVLEARRLANTRTMAGVGASGSGGGNVYQYNYNISGPHMIDEHELRRQDARQEMLRRVNRD